jgi:hypothetical protein
MIFIEEEIINLAIKMHNHLLSDKNTEEIEEILCKLDKKWEVMQPRERVFLSHFLEGLKKLRLTALLPPDNMGT